MDTAVHVSSFDSLRDFYQAAHPETIRGVRPAGRTGAELMLVEQDAGDWSDPATPDLVVGVLLDGSPVIEADIGYGLHKWAVSRGAWCAQPPHCPTQIRASDYHVFRILSVPYDRLQVLVGDGLKLPPDGDFGHSHSPRYDPAVPALVASLWNEAANGNQLGALAADGLLLQLTATLLRCKQQPAARLRGGLAPDQLRLVEEYLYARMSDDVSLVDLATLVGLSVPHFCRAFKRSKGVPPYRWLSMLRMRRAKDLLVSTRLSITEIAGEVGFRNPSHFTAAFTKAFGFNPSSVRG